MRVNAANELFVPSYTIFDAGARYSWVLGENPMTLRLKVDNVTNKKYWIGTGSDYLSEGLPRTAKLTFETQF